MHIAVSPPSDLYSANIFTLALVDLVNSSSYPQHPIFQEIAPPPPITATCVPCRYYIIVSFNTQSANALSCYTFTYIYNVSFLIHYTVW